MLTYYFVAPRTLKRLRAGPSGPFMDGFAEHLKNEGYTQQTGSLYLNAASHLGHYVKTQGSGLEAVTFDLFQNFREHLGSCRCPQFYRGATEAVACGAKCFLKYLSSRIAVAEFEKEKAPKPRLVVEFEEWMKNQVGLTQSSIRHNSEAAIVLIDSLGSDPSKYDPASLRDFVIECSKRTGSGSIGNLVSGTRKFLRYLGNQGKSSAGLDKAVPTVANWHDGSQPYYLSPTEVERIIATCDETSLKGIRDKAIILLLARVGLRADEVLNLRLSSMDWRDGSFIVSGKSRREERLPLTQEIGDAVVAYLKKRPQVREDQIFLRVIAPHRPLATSATISVLVTRRIHRAGVSTPRHGAHIFRHSAATHMLREGVSLYKIGKVLRHRTLDMTAHYAKVDRELLLEVAQPWPEVLKC